MGMMTRATVDMLRKTRTVSHTTLLTRLLLDPDSLVAHVSVTVDKIAGFWWRVTVRPSIAFPLHIVPIASRSRRRTRGRDSTSIRTPTRRRTRRARPV